RRMNAASIASRVGSRAPPRTARTLLVLERLEDVQPGRAACGKDRGEQAGEDRGDREDDDRGGGDGEADAVLLQRLRDQEGDEEPERDPERGADQRRDDALV